jgi:hypothetical protein
MIIGLNYLLNRIVSIKSFSFKSIIASDNSTQLMLSSSEIMKAISGVMHTSIELIIILLNLNNHYQSN